MKLILVRHGETIENQNLICQGHLDGQLTELGILQAKKLGKRLKDLHIDQIYSSDLKRANDTAIEIAKYHPHFQIIQDVRIRERYFGKMQGQKYPDDWDWGNLPPYVETNEELCIRAKYFLKFLTKQHLNETILVVCHGGIKMAFLTVLHNLPSQYFRTFEGIRNTALTIFEVDADRNHTLHIINSTDHLEN